MVSTAPGYRPTKWYRNGIFPLIPLLEIKNANEHNAFAFYFNWLFIRIWTLDNVAFELCIVADTHWGIGLIGILPYLRFSFCIPCPVKLDRFMYKYFTRKGIKN